MRVGLRARALVCSSVATIVAMACGGGDGSSSVPEEGGPGTGGSGGTPNSGTGGELSGGGAGGSIASGGNAAGGQQTSSGGTKVDGGLPDAPPGPGGTGGAGTSDAGSRADASPDANEAPDSGGGHDADASSADSGGPGSPPASIVQSGTSGALLLRGMVVTPAQAFAGEVLVEGDSITCVAASCSSLPAAATASIVATGGLIFPGLIDTHDHVLFDAFDETDWSPTQAYANHNQWTNDPRYAAMVDAKQYLNGEGASTLDLNCELDKYGELKGLIAGTTSMVGAPNPANKACYGSLARSLGDTSNGLPSDKIQTATLFPTTASADGVCANFTNGKTDAYLVHVGEGTDNLSRDEFTRLGTITTVDGCLYSAKTAIVHGTALENAQFTTMATNGMSLVWSPRSDVALYGGGVDLTRTTNIPLALDKGLNVALAPNWSITGSQNLLDELRFAAQVDRGAFGHVLTPKLLVEMVTTHAAATLGLGAVLGSIEVGKKADLLVIGGDVATPYDSLLAARPRDVRLVLVGGVPLYGDTPLQPIAPSAPGCEALDICGTAKFVCVARSGGTATDKLGQTFSETKGALVGGFAAYDALDLTSWDFSPIAPLVKCE